MSARRSGPSVKRSELAGRVRTAPCPQIVPISTDFPAWVRNRILRKPHDGVCASARNPDSGARIYKRTGSSFPRRRFSSALLSLRLRSGQTLSPPGSSCQGQRTKPAPRTKDRMDRGHRTPPFVIRPYHLVLLRGAFRLLALGHRSLKREATSPRPQAANWAFELDSSFVLRASGLRVRRALWFHPVRLRPPRLRCGGMMQ